MEVFREGVVLGVGFGLGFLHGFFEFDVLSGEFVDLCREGLGAFFERRLLGAFHFLGEFSLVGFLQGFRQFCREFRLGFFDSGGDGFFENLGGLGFEFVRQPIHTFEESGKSGDVIFFCHCVWFSFG